MVQVFEDAIRRKEGDSLAQPLWRAEQIRRLERAGPSARGCPSMF